jgi:tRNA (guanine37-N1)-methyltransferase
MSPQGATLTHEKVMALSQRPGLVLLCGRYEAIDQRLIDRRVDEEISLGDFVLSGGELPAMALIDAVVRHLPGVLGDAQSAVQDSFVNGLLDCPHYTRPEEYGVRVPDVLLGGHHAEIEKWRRQQALANTARKRPDLIVAARARIVVQGRREVLVGTGGESRGSSLPPSENPILCRGPASVWGITPARWLRRNDEHHRANREGRNRASDREQDHPRIRTWRHRYRQRERGGR